MAQIVNPKIDRYKTFLDLCIEEGGTNTDPLIIIAQEPLFSKILQWCKWYSMSNVNTDSYGQFDKDIEGKRIRIILDGERLNGTALSRIKGQNWL